MSLGAGGSARGDINDDPKSSLAVCIVVCSFQGRTESKVVCPEIRADSSRRSPAFQGQTPTATIVRGLEKSRVFRSSTGRFKSCVKIAILVRSDASCFLVEYRGSDRRPRRKTAQNASKKFELGP
jgi:hypothetical protein